MSIASTAAESSRLAAGVRIGDYIIDSELPASSASEHVYRATHLMLPRTVRLVMYPRTMMNLHPMREAYVLERMRHLGVPRLYDCGEHEGCSWLATELAEGTPLLKRLRAGALSLNEVLALVRDIADILDHAHQRGIVHRGVHAETIVCGAHGAMLVGWNETCSSAVVDSRHDVHALGVVAFLALTLDDPTMPLSERWPGAPRAPTKLIDRMLSANPAHRPTCAEVRDEIDQLGEGTVDDYGLGDVDTVVEPAVVDRRRKVRWTPTHGLPHPTPITVGVGHDGFVVRPRR